MSRTTADPWDTFRPRRGRVVALVMAAGAVVVFAGVAWAAGGGAAGGQADALFGRGDQVIFTVLGMVIAAFLVRYALIRAVPDEAGVTVRNLVLTERVAWGDVEEVRFDGGSAWPHLELVDGQSIAVMAIQRADGPHAAAEASRLAALASSRGPATPGASAARPAH